MNYNEAYKMLINAVNEYVDSNPSNPEVYCFELEDQRFMNGDAGSSQILKDFLDTFTFRGFEYLETELLRIDANAPQYVKDQFPEFLVEDWNNPNPEEMDRQSRYFISKEPMSSVAKIGKYREAFYNILYQGLTYSATGVDTYILSSVETALHLCEAIQNGFITLSPFSIYSSVETYLKFAEAGDALDGTRDERLFLPSIDKLSNLVNHDLLSDKGVVESGDWSMILNFIKDIKKWAEIEGVDPKEFQYMIDGVLDRGFVFTQINETEARISSVETYILPFMPA